MQFLKKKKALIIIIAMACIFVGIAGILFLRLRNGVVLKATTETAIQEPITKYRQDDALWEQDKLGNSKYTMESSGCLVSCVATAVSMNGNEITPGELNALFSENGVYDEEGNLQWGEVDDIIGYHAEVFSEVSNAIIDECLREGHYPVVRVRMQGIGNFHYVLIVGSEAGEYLCMDPLRDEITELSEYGERVYAIRCVWYEKTAQFICL